MKDTFLRLIEHANTLRRREEARELARRTPYRWVEFDRWLDTWTPDELELVARLSDRLNKRVLMTWLLPTKGAV